MEEREKGKLELIYEEGYEQGWVDGFDVAVKYTIE